MVIGALAATALTRRDAGRFVRGFDALLMLPLGVSAVTVGFGFLIALDEPPLDLRASWILVPLAQALVGVPFVVRTMLPVLRAVDVRLREAAAVLGASPWRVWREVDLPMVRRALLVAAGFAFAVSLGEFGATVFIARPDNPTLPVAVARLLGRPGDMNYGQAMALSTILMLVCAVAWWCWSGCGPTGAGSSGDARSSTDAGVLRMLLSLEGATVRFGGRAVLDAVDLGVAEHEVVCVLGPSGSGKSTLLRAVAGLQPLDAGRVTLDGRDRSGVPAHKREVGLMFQDHQLFPQRDVAGNIAFGPRMRGASRAGQRERVGELLELVGLPGAEHRSVAALSGGEQQRVALARALAPRPAC